MRRTIGILSGLWLASLAVASEADAQGYPPQPPGGPPPGYQPAPQGQPGYGPAPSPYPGAPPAPPPAPGGAPPAGQDQQPQGGPGWQPQGAAPGPAPGAPSGSPPPGGPGYGAGANASGGFSLGAGAGFGARGPSIGGGGEEEGAGEEEDEGTRTENEHEYRLDSLRIGNTIDASTGLFRLYSAGSGAPGTFRFSLLTSYFSGSGFLCGTNNRCALSNGGQSDQSDDATHVAGHVQISATPWSFLEAYLGVHTSASTNSLGTPQLLQVLGDTDFGIKAFLPHSDDGIFTFGGAAELWLLNGTGTVGIDSASFAIRALAMADFANRKNKDSRVPLRAFFNLGYLFDNSGKLVESIEQNERAGARITRIERFGLQINRVDSLRTGLGVELENSTGALAVVRPFVEWTIDIPVNRQGHVCDLSTTRAAGDGCLGQDYGFSTTPSRLSLGARVTPWQGLGLLAAVDIGTGATSSFIEEVTPEMPWNFYVGLSYAVDTVPQTEVKRVEVLRPVQTSIPRKSHFIQGTVVEKGTGNAIPDAMVRFDGRNLTGMITMSDGTFRTGDLDPGTYTFAVSATGYRDGQCMATIPPDGAGAPGMPGQQPGQAPGMPGMPGQQPQPGMPGQQPGMPGQQPGMPLQQPGMPGQQPGIPPQGGIGFGPFGQLGPTPQQQPYGGPGGAPYGQPGGAPYGQPGGAPYGQPGGQPAPAPTPQPGMPGQPGGGSAMPTVTVSCELEPLPKVGNVDGMLRDGEGGGAVGGASVKITDKLGRSLSLTADGAGAFRFENVPPGMVTIAAEAPNYLRAVTEIEVKPRVDTSAQLELFKRPKKPNVVVTDKELKLKKEVHFQHDSAEILPDSGAILEEIADVLRTHTEITSIEIQGHTDDSGTPQYNQRLSGDRANAVREALILNGVEPNRLSARGYGQERPLVPNTSEANRAKNRRVQLVIQK